MSLSSTTNRNDYTGNGATSVYPYTFKVFKEGDVRVLQCNLSGVEFVLVLGIDFTVSGVNNPAGGNVTLLAGNLPSGYKLTIRRVVEHKQETDIRNGGDFFPEVHEDQFDRAVMAAQQLADDVARSMRTPETISPAEFSPILPADIQTPNRVIVTNATGTGLALGLQTTLDGERVFKSDTYANLKALAATAPTTTRWGYATDLKQLFFYTGDIAIGDVGWLLVA